MNLDVHAKQLADECDAFHHVAGKPVQLGDNQFVSGCEFGDQLVRLRPDGGRAGILLTDDAVATFGNLLLQVNRRACSKT